MTKIIKEVTLKEIKAMQKEKGLSRKQLGELTMHLQSKIIINVSVGTAYADATLDYETEKGVETMLLPNYLDQLIKDNVFKGLKLHNLMFPLLCWITWAPTDWRLGRNIKRFRNMVQKIINERRAGQTQAYD